MRDGKLGREPYVVDDGGVSVEAAGKFAGCAEDVEFGVYGGGAEKGEGEGGEMHGG